MNLVRTVIFVDIDSTLVENRFAAGIFAEFIAHVATESGASAADVRQALTLENERRQRDDPNNALTMDWEDIAHTVAARFGSHPPASVDALWHERAAREGIDVLDDAHSVLQSLLRPHRRLVIATKGLAKYQQPVLDVTGLGLYFDDVLTPDRTGCLKTEPCFFRAYTSGGFADTLFIQVGDHYFDDVICARRNGFLPVLRAPIAALGAEAPLARIATLAAHAASIPTYRQPEAKVWPEAVVISLAEVPTLIDTLEARHALH
jgi:putative hydrolase of the HAD superfamily